MTNLTIEWFLFGQLANSLALGTGLYVLKKKLTIAAAIIFQWSL